VKLDKTVIDELMVSPGSAASLGERSTSETEGSWLGSIGRSEAREVAEQDLEKFRRELERVQELLYANATWAVLIVLQGIDASGKDGTIKHVMSGVNPQGCDVVSFKQPSAEELRHDFLWRCVLALPERGRIGIFNRSYYEEVLVCRVHPELIEHERIPGQGGVPDRRMWEARYEDINAFERHLHRNGTRIVKLFLHLSKEEQRRRLLARLVDSERRWKFSVDDLAERSYFAEYTRAYEEAIGATSTRWAPWYVVPADHKYAARALVGGLLVHAIDELELRPPAISEEQSAALERARKALEAE
jgi:PPK2 family polyphosphate:nucleotide phosphotransferase